MFFGSKKILLGWGSTFFKGGRKGGLAGNLELIIWGRFSENWAGKNVVQKILIITNFWVLIVFMVFVLNHCFFSLEIDFKDFLKSFWAFFIVGDTIPTCQEIQ